MTELQRVETVAGQVPLPGMGERQLRRRPVPVRRPDGQLYRSRRYPEAVITGGQVDEVTGVAVLRTHSVELAEQLARQALAADDPAAFWLVRSPRTSWGRWRRDRSAEYSTWVADESGRTGTPAVFFDVEAG